MYRRTCAGGVWEGLCLKRLRNGRRRKAPGSCISRRIRRLRARLFIGRWDASRQSCIMRGMWRRSRMTASWNACCRALVIQIKHLCAAGRGKLARYSFGKSISIGSGGSTYGSPRKYLILWITGRTRRAPRADFPLRPHRPGSALRPLRAGDSLRAGLAPFPYSAGRAGLPPGAHRARLSAFPRAARLPPGPYRPRFSAFPRITGRAGNPHAESVRSVIPPVCIRCLLTAPLPFFVTIPPKFVNKS